MAIEVRKPRNGMVMNPKYKKSGLSQGTAAAEEHKTCASLTTPHCSKL